MRARGPTLFLARLLTALLSVSLLLLALEGALRVIYDEPDIRQGYWGPGAFVEDQAAGYRHAPGYQGQAIRKGEFVTEVSINEIGLRQRDLASQLAYSRRLLILGDSFAFGLGVEEEESFAHLLQATSNPLGIGVINGGQTGYSIAQELALAQDLVTRLDPQTLLLCLYLGNDVTEDYFEEGRRIEIRYGYRMTRGRRPSGATFDWLRSHSYLWRVAAERIDRKRAAVRQRKVVELGGTELDRMLQPALRSLDGVVAMSSARHLSLVVALVPPVDGKRQFEDAILDYLRERGVGVVDLHDYGFERGDYFAADGHWNAEGHRKAAAVFAEILSDRSDVERAEPAATSER